MLLKAFRGVYKRMWTNHDLQHLQQYRVNYGSSVVIDQKGIISITFRWGKDIPALMKMVINDSVEDSLQP